MRFISIIGVALIAAACSSSTDIEATRYNFKVIDGLHQQSTAGDAELGKRVTSKLARDPQGQFASWVLDFLSPAIAYAQQLDVPGEPVGGAIVCGREAEPGEPQVIPLCAFTLADGKAANAVKGGTKAGTFTLLFTAQVESQEPVQDSTTVTVLPGPMASHRFTYGSGFTCRTTFPADYVKDQYGNSVPYRMLTTGPAAHVVSDVMGSEGARTFVADTDTQVPAGAPPGQGQPVTVEVSSGVIATGEITASNTTQACVTIWFGN